MVNTRTVRGILRALAEALPEEGEDILTGLEIRDAWGDAVLVRLHTRATRSPATDQLAERLRMAVLGEVGDLRHRVEIVWGSIGLLR